MRKNNQKCGNRGCRRVRKRPSLFCRWHGRSVSSAAVARPTTKNTNGQNQQVHAKHPYRAVLGTLVPEIDRAHISEIVQSTLDGEKGTGSRALIPVEGGGLDAYLLDLTRQAITSIGNLRCTDPVIKKPKIVRAPAVSSESNGWTKGPKHPDQVDHTKSGLYTGIYFLDDVTAENGAIQMWPNTALLPFNPKNKVKKDEPSEIITGDAGTLLVFDSRIVHQSLPNKTKQNRDTVAWLFCSKKNEGAFNIIV